MHQMFYISGKLFSHIISPHKTQLPILAYRMMGQEFPAPLRWAVFDGKEPSGEVGCFITDCCSGCKVCTCSSGTWTCDDSQCSASCLMYGESHFSTLDGNLYSYQSPCTLRAMEVISPNGDNLMLCTVSDHTFSLIFCLKLSFLLLNCSK